MIATRKLARFALLVIAVVALAATAAGCGSDDNNVGNNKPDELTAGSTDGSVAPEPVPIQMVTGVDTGVRVSKPTAIIVHTEADLKKLDKQNRKGGKEDAPLTGTDFNSRQIVGVFVPAQKPGTQLVIDAVEQDKKKDMIKVSATMLGPGKGCKTKGYGRYPYQVVNTRKMEGEPYLVLDTGKQSPCT